MDDEVTTKDLYTLIKGLVAKSDEIQKQNTDIKEELKREIRTIKIDLTKELENIKQENTKLSEENKLLKKRLIQSERKLKKYNLVFYGLEETDSEVEDIERFLNVINTKIEINCRSSDIRDIYRIGKQQKEESKVRPVLVEFINYKLKADILRNARKLKGTGIYVAVDNTPEDYQKQKVLRFHQNVARQNNQEAKIKNNTLYINGEKVLYENLTEDINDNVAIEEEKEQELKTKTYSDKTGIQDLPGLTRTTLLDSEDAEQTRKRKLKQIVDKENPTKRITRPKTKHNST